jgi:hypothetical protein
MTRLATRWGGRRLKSAKARNPGKWGTAGAAGYGDLAAASGWTRLDRNARPNRFATQDGYE